VPRSQRVDPGAFLRSQCDTARSGIAALTTELARLDAQLFDFLD
jgi:hypothetical protein